MCCKTLRIDAPFDPRRNITDAYIFLMLLIFPLFTGFRGYSAITASKFWFFAGLTVLWLLLLTACSLAVQVRPARPSAAQCFALVFVLAACLCALASEFRASCFWGAGRYDGLVSLLLYGAAFLGVSRFGTFRPYHAAVFGISISLCCIVCILQLLGFNPLRLFPGDYCYYDAHIKFTSEFLGTIGNVNLLADVLCLSIPLFASLFICSDGHCSRLCLAPLLLSVLVLTASGVSGGVVAAAGCALVAAPLLLSSMVRLRRALSCLASCALAAAAAFCLDAIYSEGILTLRFSFPGSAAACCAAAAVSAATAVILSACKAAPSAGTLRRIVLLFCILALCATFLAVWFWPGGSGTMYELSRVLHGQADDSFGSSRIRIWREVLALVPEHPLLGGGPGTLALRLDIRFSRFVEETGKTLSSYVDNAHNVYLQYLADTGLFGLCSVLALYGSAFLAWLRSSLSPLRAGAGLAVLCGCIHNFFGLGLCLSAPLFWLFLGLMTVPDKINISPGGPNENQ